MKTTIKSLLSDFNDMRVANDDDAIVKWTKTKNALVVAIADYESSHDIDNTMSVAELARELNVNPKIARAKLRRRGVFATNGHHVRFERDDETFVKYVAIITSQKTADAS